MNARPSCSSPESDETLVQRFQQGDRTAFNGLVARYRDPIYNMAYLKLGHREEAEDAAEEVFVAAYCSLPGFRGEARFRTWLYTLATRTICRCKKRRPPWWSHTEPLDDFAEVLPDQTEDPAREVERADWNRQVRRALQGLPEKYRQPLVLCYVEELSYEEIAAILQIPLGTLSWRINQGKKLLAQRLKSLTLE